LLVARKGAPVRAAALVEAAARIKYSEKHRILIFVTVAPI
jgi:hypothetical protein